MDRGERVLTICRRVFPVVADDDDDDEQRTREKKTREREEERMHLSKHT
jgi:hypothetical protein